MGGDETHRISMTVLLFVIPAAGGNLLLERPAVCGEQDDLLTYDDGTAWWLTWNGLYRGVWYHLGDFYGSYPPDSIRAFELELWFYHYGSYPWDTGSFYAELYDGTPAGPQTLLYSESVTASHYSPCYAYPPWDVVIHDDFWELVNTELSSGGWPSLLGDNSPCWAGSSHSFTSDDFAIWEPWVIQGPEANDFLVRLSPEEALSAATWGGIKVLY